MKSKVLASLLFIGALLGCSQDGGLQEEAPPPVETALGSSVPESNSASWDRGTAAAAVSPHNHSGSGYRKLEGKVINYAYDNFSGFQVAIFDNRIKWKGFQGYFHGVVSQVDPQISEIRDGLYFMSWLIPDGGDNVVVNLNAMRVSAHLRSGDGAGGGADFAVIHGEVLCFDEPACAFPDGDPTLRLALMPMFIKNSLEFGLQPMPEVVWPDTSAEVDARAELAGQTVAYETPNGLVEVAVDGEQTHVSLGDAGRQSFKSYATKIDEGIYFISWLGDEKYGDHIVVNQSEMKVYDHVFLENERQEAVYRITCFGWNDACQQ